MATYKLLPLNHKVLQRAPEEYRELLYGCITNNYKKAPLTLETNISEEGQSSPTNGTAKDFGALSNKPDHNNGLTVTLTKFNTK